MRPVDLGPYVGALEARVVDLIFFEIVTVLTLHVPGHEPLFSIRPRETQGFSLDFRQHVSAAGLSWRLRNARRDTWTRAARCCPQTRRKVSRLVRLYKSD